MGGSTAHMDQFLCSRVFETSQEDAKGAAALTCWRSRHTAPLRTKRDVSKHFEKPETADKQGPRTVAVQPDQKLRQRRGVVMPLRLDEHQQDHQRNIPPEVAVLRHALQDDVLLVDGVIAAAASKAGAR